MIRVSQKAICVGVVVAFAVVLNNTVFDGAYNVIATPSMSPDIAPYALVLVNIFEPYEKIKVGDIISFQKNHEPVPTLHRVIERGDTITTQGDANPGPIERLDYDITKEEYIGKLAYALPLGEYGKFLTLPDILYIGIPILVIILCFTKSFRKFVRTGHWN